MNNMLAGTFILATVATAAGYAVQPEPPMIEYRETVSAGDTIWDVCDRVSDGRENLQELVWRTTKENHISKPGQIQPGKEIVIKVKAVKNVQDKSAGR